MFLEGKKNFPMGKNVILWSFRNMIVCRHVSEYYRKEKDGASFVQGISFVPDLGEFPCVLVAPQALPVWQSFGRA